MNILRESVRKVGYLFRSLSIRIRQRPICDPRWSAAWMCAKDVDYRRSVNEVAEPTLAQTLSIISKFTSFARLGINADCPETRSSDERIEGDYR